MSSQTLKQRIDEDMKAAMRAKDKPRLGTIRLITAAMKQREVDERIVLDDAQVLVILDKMLKQRRDSLSQYEAAARTDLAAQEAYEIGIIQEYLPTPLSEAEIGAMIEIPSAALVSNALAKRVNFFSIGTNDLVQYTLAVDRGNANIASRFTPLHPAVLRLIKRTVEVGQGAGLEVAVCGEMASQPLMAFALLGLGVRQLSVAPRSVALVKRIVRGVSVEIARKAADAAMAAPTAARAEEILREQLMGAFGDGAF